MRGLPNLLAVRLENEVQPASLRTGRTTFHNSRLTTLLSIAARTLRCKYTERQLAITGSHHNFLIPSACAAARRIAAISFCKRLISSSLSRR